MACLKKAQLLFFKDPFSRVIWQYVFPIQFVFGILGNSLNLWVLASDELPNIASDMLAAVSFCDLAFLIVMLPHCLASYESLAYDINFRYFYLNTKQHMSAVANWMSAAAIWYLIVRSPFRAKLYWQRGRMVVVLSSILITTGLLTVYHHFEWDCEIEEFCNGTQLVDFCYYSGMRHQRTYRNHDWVDPSDAKKVYLRFAIFLNAILVVFVPIVLVIVLNMMMIRQLHKNWTSPRIESMRGTITRNQIRQRQRVTITVISIGLCFSLTQGPSAFMVLYELFSGYVVGSTFFAIFSITNSLVVMGKTINFILFCLSSKHFRRKCLLMVHRKFPKLSQSQIGKRLIDHHRCNSMERASMRTNRSRRGSTTIARDCSLHLECCQLNRVDMDEVENARKLTTTSMISKPTRSHSYRARHNSTMST